MNKKHIACLISVITAGLSSPVALATTMTPATASDTVYFNQKTLPSDTQGTLAGNVSLAQSVIMPTVNKIDGDRQPHLVSLRKALVIFEPSSTNGISGNDISVVVKDSQGNRVHHAILQAPAAQPKPAGQIETDVTIVVPDSYAHTLRSNNTIGSIAGEQGQTTFKSLLTEHDTIQVATSDGNFAYEFILPEVQEFTGKIVTFSSQAGYNSTIRYTHGADTLSHGNSITYNNVDGLWYAQSDVDYGNLAYSDKAYTTVLPAEVIEPGFSLTFTAGSSEGIVEGIQVGANTTLILNTVDVGLLTPPRGEFRFMEDKKLHRDYFQSLQISKLIVNPYAPIHLEEIMLPDGRLLIDVDPSKADAYGSDSHYRIARELISAGINSANYGVNSAYVRDHAAWNISAPYHAAQITVNNSIGKYSDGLIAHGLLGSYSGVASVVSSTGNEFSHEVGHELGAGIGTVHPEAHYLGGFAGSVHNSSTKINSTWGWDLFENIFLPNLSKARTNGATCYDGECAQPFEGHSFGKGTMAGGWPLHPDANAYTLHTPYELNVFQTLLESKANFDAASPTGFSQWDKQSQTMVPWANTLIDDLAFNIVVVSGNNELNNFDENSRQFHELFATADAVRLNTGNGYWARDFYLPEDVSFEGKVAVFRSSAGYNSHIHFGGSSVLLINGQQHAFRFEAGQWNQVDSNIIDRTVDRVPHQQGVAVTTLVGYYDPQNILPSYFYPALNGAYGSVYKDNFTPSSCQIDVLTQHDGTLTFNLHNRRLNDGLMNRFHINVATDSQPYRAELYCNNNLLDSMDIVAPTATLKAGIVTTELGEVPMLSGTEHLTVQQGDAFDPIAGVTAFDAEDGDITASVKVTGHVDTLTPGSYSLIYSVTDSEGQTVSEERTITVEASEVCLSAWQRGAVYIGDDKVTHNGHVWKAGWWTQGEEPGTTGEWGVWKQTDDNSCGSPDPDPEVTPPEPGEYPTYQAGFAYQAGDIVTGADNTLYQCKPWPNSGWCASASYAPATSAFWQDAWTKL
ncbi:M66 family metalloprotease [Enterovibrio makurazakiensis]|uniref:M66 family metalloprotease n=1 Tax=Enterovibrio makurazakiensis TaxID=2910232 RepID=UPI003D241FA0